MKIWFIFPLVFSALLIRYFLLSGLAYEFFWNWRKNKFAPRRIQKLFPKTTQLMGEVKWSLSTLAIFALGSLTLYGPAMAGKTKLYFDIAQRGWPYFVLSLGGLILAHDTYFYWAHRFMHLKWVFKHVHRIHHLSTNPSPLAAFAFHPLEALIEGAFVGIAVYTVPLHPSAVFVFLIFSHGMNIMGHLGYELFPSGFIQKRLLGLVTTSTHHNMHHRYFSGNYGLYFNFWDRLLKTNHPLYEKIFEEVASRPLKNTEGSLLPGHPSPTL